jgi:ornithine carbamoyltransferase
MTETEGLPATDRARPGGLLRIADLDAATLADLLAMAATMKQRPLQWRRAHDGRVLGCFFSKPSTRTRVSLEAAAYRLGMLPVMLRPDELQLGRGEPLSDTARVLSSYTDALAIRTFAHRDVQELADWADVPVINALSDDHHPCQALADLLTLAERFGKLEGLKLAYVGDGNNVAHSLMEAGALSGMDVAVASPPGFEPDRAVTETAQAAAGERGSRVIVLADPREAVKGAHAVYTDVWVSMGQESEREQRMSRLAGYRVDAALMALADPDAVFMHCLPAHRGEEVTAEVIDGPKSLVFQQAANRLPTAQAAIHRLLEAGADAGRGDGR